jgi:tRNA-splicing ligase RtcB (3'-phosphate/5'-hydroxy nucleic acid ligase)
MKIFGTHEAGTIQQLETCVLAVPGAQGVLCADGHIGYSMPIGGVVAYRNHVSPSGVGYDIACGNMAVRTDMRTNALTKLTLPLIATDIQKQIDFGVGGKNATPEDHSVLHLIRNSPVSHQRQLIGLASSQLGTVGSGNHYVDLLEDGEGFIWVAVHFGSRGFGHKTATGFLNLARGEVFDAHGGQGEMFSPPVLLEAASDLGQAYIQAMTIAGLYAAAGREAVIRKVLEILGAKGLETVSNHHNYAWREEHQGELFWVVRKGATPAFPNQRGFVGGSMGDISVILEGVDSAEARESFYSTVHGAGRVMSRNVAKKGKHQWKCPVPYSLTEMCSSVYQMPRDARQMPKNQKCPIHGVQLVKEQLSPAINFRDVQDRMKAKGIVLRGAGPDEAPEVYRPLNAVLGAHQNSVRIVKVLHPRLVVMAGADVKDPYKD